MEEFFAKVNMSINQDRKKW